MTAAEVWFLRAEAALRNWTDEDAGICYEKGITSSLHQYGIMQTDSYLNSDKLPIDFVDTFDAENNIKAYILQDYCMSSGGEKYHYEAIDILKRSIGEKFII